ncbi:hypothetical protein BSFA1_79680 (plasmid) [Burkholderia sp. SFA1]|nr:hypothetical protein BYI23_E000760 [Burkholderia sp. YI23]BBQ02840.1 hypothetical protein BSFA1_79680 [Burkholderia sp. SFA1]
MSADNRSSADAVPETRPGGAVDSVSRGAPGNDGGGSEGVGNGREGGGAGGGGTDETQRTHRPRSLTSGLAYAAAVTLFLLLAKTFFEFTAFGHQIELVTFAALTRVLTQSPEKDRLDIVVLDLGGGTTDGSGGLLNGFQVSAPTDRARLTEIIDALANVHAKAVAVDIDFSPNSGGFIDRQNDPTFFSHCLEISNRTMPVFLGVFRARNFPARNWLGLPKYAPLAVDLGSTDTSERFTETHRALVVPVRSQQLPSLSYALAQRYDHSLPGLPSWLGYFLRPTEESAESGEGQLVNYGKVWALKTQRSVALTRSAILGAAADFEDRVVVLGDVTGPHAESDSINWPFGLEFPRVLYHASAFYTYTKAPLYEFNFWTRNALDILVASPFFILVVLRSRYAGALDTTRWKKIEKRTLWISEIVILVTGVILVFAARVMWLDFLLVMAALALHPFLNEWIESRVEPLVNRLGTRP